MVGNDHVIIIKDITFESMLYFPKLYFNLLSINKLDQDLKCVTTFFLHICEFQDLDSGKKLDNAKEYAWLYLFGV